MRTELVIFDCDGVLVDSERIAVRVERGLLADLGLHFTEAEIIDRFVGRSPSVLYEVIAEHLGRPVDPEMRAGFRQAYRDAFVAELQPVDGIVEALEEINLPKCVASSSEPDSLRRKLDLTALSGYFDGQIFSARQVTRGKPAPDLFLFAAGEMGVDPAACVVIEDSQYGVQAGRAAGMRVLAYTGGISDPATLRQDGAVLFGDMRELPALIDGSGQ